jgi:hypothetical protein
MKLYVYPKLKKGTIEILIFEKGIKGSKDFTITGKDIEKFEAIDPIIYGVI